MGMFGSDYRNGWDKVLMGGNLVSMPRVGPSMPAPDAGQVMAQPTDPNVKTTTTETTKTVTEPVTPAEPSVDAKRQAARNATDKATIHRGMGGPGAGARGQKQGLGA